MKIIIHGIKSGYSVLYFTSGSPLISDNHRSAARNEVAVGQQAYSIAIVENACMFTKFVITRHFLRNMAHGLLPSLFILQISKNSLL